MHDCFCILFVMTGHGYSHFQGTYCSALPWNARDWIWSLLNLKHIVSLSILCWKLKWDRMSILFRSSWGHTKSCQDCSFSSTCWNHVSHQAEKGTPDLCDSVEFHIYCISRLHERCTSWNIFEFFLMAKMEGHKPRFSRGSCQKLSRSEASKQQTNSFFATRKYVFTREMNVGQNSLDVNLKCWVLEFWAFWNGLYFKETNCEGSPLLKKKRFK